MYRSSITGVDVDVACEEFACLGCLFQVGVASKLENKTVCTSFSLNAHGSEEAWQKAVEAYARHKSIHKNSKLYQRLLKAKPNVAS